ncbi:hypothetical protein [Streptomyces olivochromogenes]|uniref:hypothetical protein n=1 Tax=Streptomyces olivochromogenes TaxID=1963 RepID=UPI00131BDE35|nr:hypothetical protein [Streptomyces olivochromogenes]
MTDLITTEDNDNDDVTDVEATEDEWTPPTREEWEGVLAKKKTADSEAASRKRWLRDLGYDPKTGEKLTDVSETGSDAAAKEDVQTDAAKPAQVDTAAIEKAASAKATARVISLVEAGVDPKSLDLVDRLIDPDEDLTAQLETLKEKAPGLFKRPRTTNVADASAVGAGSKKTPTGTASTDYREKLAKSILGR